MKQLSSLIPRKSRRQKYRRPPYSSAVDPKHIHPRHLRDVPKQVPELGRE